MGLKESWNQTLTYKLTKQYQRISYEEIWNLLDVPERDRGSGAHIGLLTEMLEELGFTKASTVRNAGGKVCKGWKRDSTMSDKEWLVTQKSSGKIIMLERDSLELCEV